MGSNIFTNHQGWVPKFNSQLGPGPNHTKNFRGHLSSVSGLGSIPPPCWCYPPSSLSHPGPALPSRLVSLAHPGGPGLEVAVVSGGGAGGGCPGWPLQYSTVRLTAPKIQFLYVSQQITPDRHCTTSGDATASTTVTSPDVVYGVPPSCPYQCPPPNPPTSPSVGFGSLLL